MTQNPATAPTAVEPAVPPVVLRARTAVAVVFGLNGLAIASWFARVPAARDALQLTAGQLGVLLLATSVGSLLALPTAGLVAQRFGATRTVAGGTLLLGAGLLVIGLGAGTWASIPAVAAGLFAFGYGAGTCEVAMNVQAAVVERRLGRTVMPRFHAAWSVGSVAGAAAGAAAAGAGLPVVVHLGAVTVVLCAGTLTAIRAFLPPGADGALRASGGRRSVLAAWREPRTLLVGALVLVMAFTEGTANDWLAVAFIDGHGLGEAGGAAVFGVFVAAMTLGRTAGTVALDRWGRVPVLLATMLLAVAGAGVAVLAGSVPVAVCGVLLWGLGASLGFPVGMSAAADEEAHAAARVSVVAVLGYTAFLAGPPVVGLLGDRVGALRALLLVPVLLIPALLLVPALRPPAPQPPPSGPAIDPDRLPDPPRP